MPDDCVYLIVERSDEEQPQTYAVPIAYLRAALSAHGLTIVSEADRKVLEAMGQVHRTRLMAWCERYDAPFADACRVELEARKTRAK